MPTISSFFGISIRMFYDDHAPPHFHAGYAGDEAVIEILPLRMLRGALPIRARSMVLEWAGLHQQELLEDWNLARDRRPLICIPPLR